MAEEHIPHQIGTDANGSPMFMYRRIVFTWRATQGCYHEDIGYFSRWSMEEGLQRIDEAWEYNRGVQPSAHLLSMLRAEREREDKRLQAEIDAKAAEFAAHRTPLTPNDGSPPFRRTELPPRQSLWRRIRKVICGF